jgi:hypothetical protein
VFIPANEREATAAAPAILRVLSEKDMAGFLEQREREKKKRRRRKRKRQREEVIEREVGPVRCASGNGLVPPRGAGRA